MTFEDAFDYGCKAFLFICLFGWTGAMSILLIAFVNLWPLLILSH